MINRNTISKLLNKPYDRVLFAVDILKPVFQNFQMLAQAVEANIELTQTEQKAISKVFIYGTITLSDDTEITCYEIILQPSVHIEQSKVSIQQYVRKLLISGQAALINFVSPVNKEIWRFTLVAKDSVLTENGVKETATHAKRYTYLVETGANKQNRTLAERLEKLSSEMFQNFDALVNTFSVETLSKAFFDEYKAHYNKFIQYLNTSNFFTSVFKTNDKTVRDFTKKLLGRLVFLYFVQRKGWLGASNNQYKDGKHDFLMYLFLQSGSNDSFYPVWLKTLFFDTLNNSAKNGDFRMPDGTMVKIPFLNGGLFDKDDIDTIDFSIPSELFHNDTQSEIPVKRGFFDFLNAFNFTIYEDSPDDHTVAVDPEMLGHIFENLLEDNKDKGAFYTPKQIVHYMCQESLIEYLNTKLNVFEVPLGYTGTGLKTEKVKTKPGQLMLTETENRNNIQRNELADFVQNKNANPFIFEHAKQIDRLLDEVKICDPAIGSGAFPVGLLHEIFQLKVVLKEFVFEQSVSLFSESHYEPVNYYARLKENIIQNSIYGVDIEKGAVDIARLRFWLSLVVDEDVPKPLPNLDYKIVVGNSLISMFEEEVLEIDWKLTNNPALKQSRPDLFKRINETIQNIFVEQKDFFHQKSDKTKLKLKIRNLKIELLEILIEIQKQVLKEKGINLDFANKKQEITEITERKLKFESLNKMLSKLQIISNNDKLHLNYFDWKLDFPEIMNPVLNANFGFDIVIGNPPYVEHKKLKHIASFLKPKYEVYTGSSDLSVYFFELGFNIQKKETGLITIINTNKFFNTGYGKALRAYLLSKTIKSIVNFEQVPIFENVLVSSVIFSAQNQKDSKSVFRYSEFSKEKDWSLNFKQKIIERTIQYKISDFNDNEWSFQNKEAISIKDKIEKAGVKIKNISTIDIKRGVTTGFDPAFIIDEKQKSDLNSELIKPLLKGREIKRNQILYSGQYLIFTRKGIDIDKHISIKNYLSQYFEDLQPRNSNDGKGRKPGTYNWFEIQDNTAYYPLFDEPKIIWPLTADKWGFALDLEKHYLTSGGFLLVSSEISLKYILAVLNSKLMKYYFKFIGVMTAGGAYTLKKATIEDFPLKYDNKKAIESIEILVDYILFLNKNQIQSINEYVPNSHIVQVFDEIIDALVFELYFADEFKKVEIEFLKFIHRDFMPIEKNENESEKIEIIHNSYQKLREKDNEIRNNLKIMDIRLSELVMPIKIS